MASLGTRLHTRHHSRRASLLLVCLLACTACEPAEPRPAKTSKPDIALIVIDTLRADRMSLYGNPQNTTPRIDAWAARAGIVFERALAAAPWTLPSHASLFSGLLAERHGANLKERLPEDLPLLAERLREHGYETVAITGGGYLHPHWGFGRGFDEFHHAGDGDSGSKGALDTYVELAKQRLARRSSAPFFLFFHTYEVHPPLVRRSPYFGRFSPERREFSIAIQRPGRAPDDGYREQASLLIGGFLPGRSQGIELIRDVYDSNVAYTDERIGELLETLEASKRPTLIVLTSDHGEMLGEHGLADHFSLYEENLRVPLVIATTPRSEPRRVPGQVRLIDVTPTLMDLVGITADPSLDGVSLRPFLEGSAGARGREAWSYAGESNYGIALQLLDGRSYLYDDTAWVGGREELYDRVRDPRQWQNLAPTTREVEGLRVRVEEHLAATLPGLRLRLRNPGPGVLSGALTSLLPGPSALKMIRGSCRCLEWLPPNGAALRLESGADVTLAIANGPLQSEVGIALTLASPALGDARTETSIDLLSGAGPWHVVYRQGAWHTEREAQGENLPGLSIWWKTPPREPGLGRIADPDPALEAQLRALGYAE